MKRQSRNQTAVPTGGDQLSVGSHQGAQESDEDMDLSSDNEDDITQTNKQPVNVEGPSRDSTPALSNCSETSEADTDLGDWSRELFDENLQLVEPAVNPTIVIEDVSTAQPEAHTKLPLFMPSPHPSPCKATSYTTFPDDLPIPFILDPKSPLATNLPSPNPCPVRRFLSSLRRPCGHHYDAFYAVGIRTEEDIHALSGMPGEWEVVYRELSSRGVTLMEWLYIKAGLERSRQGLVAGTLAQPKLDWEG